jgi:hypothetical protein
MAKAKEETVGTSASNIFFKLNVGQTRAVVLLARYFSGLTSHREYINWRHRWI